MVRQNGERIVHFDDGMGTVCWHAGETSRVSTDPRETTCGVCLRTEAWRTAWYEAPKKVAAP